MPSTVTPQSVSGALAAPATARVDIVVPVHNEEAALARSIRRLHARLKDELPFEWRIVIANNASTDQRAAIAALLAHELDGVTLRDLPMKGRGRALRAAWMASDA